MTMSLYELEIPAGPDVYYDPGFRNLLEAHLEWLKVHPQTRTVAIDTGSAHKHQYDFTGLLMEYGVPRHLCWLTLRLNGYANPNEFTEGRETILIPSEGLISQLTIGYLSSQKK